MAIINTSNLPAPVQISFNQKLLLIPTPNFIHTIAASRKVMPRNGGHIMRFRRYNRLPAATTPLGNSGNTPPPTNPTIIDVDARISFYGQYMILNEQVTLTNQDPVLNQLTKILAISMRETEDILTRDMLVSSASFVNCTAGLNGDSPTELTRADISDVSTALLSANAYTIADLIEGKDKFGTAPIRESFIGMANTDLIPSLNTCQGFVAKQQYPIQTTLQSEWGAVDNVRFMVSSIGAKTAQSSNLNRTVYSVPITGMEAYSVVEQDGFSSRFIFRNTMVAGGPLAQNATLGWKSAMAQVILNNKWVIVARCTL